MSEENGNPSPTRVCGTVIWSAEHSLHVACVVLRLLIDTNHQHSYHSLGHRITVPRVRMSNYFLSGMDSRVMISVSGQGRKE